MQESIIAMMTGGLILYVDDITLLGEHINTINQIKAKLSDCYKMTNLGKISSYLGINIK
jgi:Reverse transcriptase (RNA-dependent DNA polymerase)